MGCCFSVHKLITERYLRRRHRDQVRPSTRIQLQNETDYKLPGPFLLSYSVCVFRFSLFSLLVPCVRLSWSFRQLLSSIKYTVSYHIVYKTFLLSINMHFIIGLCKVDFVYNSLIWRLVHWHSS